MTLLCCLGLKIQILDPSDWSQPEAGDLGCPPSLDPQLETFLEREVPLPEAEGEQHMGPPLTMPPPRWHGRPNKSICPPGGQSW